MEILHLHEIRVLGALIEKQIATPEYYPLTLNALINACNQKTSRDPVVSYDETMVLRALDALREKKLIRVVSGPDSRVAKYRQVFTDIANLTQPELAILCVLLLRGAQTGGELRTRTERLHSFESLAEVEKGLQRLIERDPEPLVHELRRQAGTKEPRFAHLLGGPIVESDVPLSNSSLAGADQIDLQRVLRLEEEVARLMAMAEAAHVETESLLIVTEHVTQNANDKREVEPALKALEQLAQPLGKAEALCWVYFDSAAKSYPDIAAVELKSDSLLALI